MSKQKELYSRLDKGMSLGEIQDYIKSVIGIRGFGGQPVEQEVLLLIEEVGELAKAIRNEKTNMGVDQRKVGNVDTVENEIADVFIVLVSACNTLGIDLFEALREKERINIERSWDSSKE